MVLLLLRHNLHHFGVGNYLILYRLPFSRVCDISHICKRKLIKILVLFLSHLRLLPGERVFWDRMNISYLFAILLIRDVIFLHDLRSD
jgi:hypothetical protein